MKLICTKCSAEIKAENINITTDLAKCDNCGSIYKVSDLSHSLEKKDINPPNGSKIILKKGLNDEIEFTYPKKGLTASLLPQLFFAIFWLSFVAFWSWGASQGSFFFALFSIPFWVIGISMIVGIVNSANEVQIVTINKNKLIVNKLRPIRPKLFETSLENIQTIKMKGLKMSPFSMFGNFRNMIKMQRSFGSAIEMPAIITGLKTEYFFDDANDAEQEWIVNILDRLVKKLINK